MIRVYDTDNGSDYVDLVRLVEGDFRQALPRRELYGSSEAEAIGLTPVESVPDILLQPDQYVDAIAEAHEQQTLPIYHMYHTWRPKGVRFNQGNIGYCWTWSGTGCVMTTRALEDKDTTILAPVSMGYLVGWANRGNYLGSFIKGAREQGICPAVNGNMNDQTRNASYWDKIGRRNEFQLDKVWDTRVSAMIQHCVSILKYGRSLYAAWDHLSHAMEVLGVWYEGSVLQWLVGNSHNEDDVIIMTGSRAVPSEAYGFISTKQTGV